jgi:hypothetical protein
VAFCFQVILKTPRFIIGTDLIKHLHCVKGQMKCETDTVSGHLSRFEAPSFQKFFSSPIPL